MRLRQGVKAKDVRAIHQIDLQARVLVTELRLLGARKAANAVARARKSIQGAVRHARRCTLHTPGEFERLLDLEVE